MDILVSRWILEEYDISELVSKIDFNSNQLNQVGNLLLTNVEIEILELYNINYKSCKDLKQLLTKIDKVIDEEEDCDDLDLISMSIAERDYYQNTNK